MAERPEEAPAISLEKTDC